MATHEGICSSVVGFLRAGKSLKDIIEQVNVSIKTVYNIKKAWEKDKTTYTPKRKQHKLRYNAFGADFDRKV